MKKSLLSSETDIPTVASSDSVVAYENTFDLKKEPIKHVNEFVFKVNNINKFFKEQKALDDVSFVITKGRFHALVGENGSGKSTMIKMLIGASSDKKYSGFIESNENLEISFFPEIAVFPGNWNTYQYLCNTRMVKIGNLNKTKMVVDEVMKQLNILDLAKKNPNSFSSGQKKKVLLARIMIEDPDVIILDEPAANLDIAYRKFLFEQLKILNEKGKTIILTSHLLTEINPYIDEATILYQGQLFFSGKIKKETLEAEYAKVINKIWKKT